MERTAAEMATAVVKGYKQAGFDEVFLPDVIADLRHAEVVLAEYRRQLTAEVDRELEGNDFVLKEERKAKRSFNGSGLIAAFRGEREDTANTILRLMHAGVLKFTWSWSALRRFADQENVTLAIAQHEIGEGDTAHVGEVWTSEFKTKPK